MKRWPILALALCAALPAAAQQRARFADPPADRSLSSVEAWLASNVDKGPYAYVGADAEGGRFLFASRFQKLNDSGIIRAWVRTEFFQPQLHAALTYRSSNTLRDYDCKERRVRDLAADAFPLLNLQGEPHSENAQAPKWRYLRLGDLEREELKAACTLRDKRLAEAEKE